MAMGLPERNAAPLAVRNSSLDPNAGASLWRSRVQAAEAAARSFETVAAELSRGGVIDLANEALPFAAAEKDAARLCWDFAVILERSQGKGRVTSRYRPRRERPQSEARMVTADVISPIEAALREVLRTCCLGRTVTVSLLTAERHDAIWRTYGAALEHLQRLAVDHSRFGWRVVASLSGRIDESTRGRLADHLRIAFGDLLDHELAPLFTSAPHDGRGLTIRGGDVLRSEARALVLDTVARTILPSLELHGFAAREAWARRVRFD